MDSLWFDILDPDRQQFQHVNDVSSSSVIFSSPCWSVSFLAWWAALLMRSQGVREKNKAKITRCCWKLCQASSHSICASKKQKPKWFPQRIPCFILGSAIKSEHEACLYSLGCTFHTGNAFIFQHTLVTYSYQSVITFGGYCDDFMVVTSQQREPGPGKKSVEKLVFAMSKPKVSDICSVMSICTNDRQASALPAHVRLSLVLLSVKNNGYIKQKVLDKWWNRDLKWINS